MILIFLSWYALQLQQATGAEFLPINLTEMARSADLVVVGDCIGVESRWNAKRTKIYTYARFQATEKIKGSVTDGDIVVAFLGGTIGKISQVAVGLPHPVPGQRGLLFLSKAKTGGARALVGGAWGMLPVKMSAAEGALVELPQADALGPETEPRQFLPLPTLRHAIQSSLD